MHATDTHTHTLEEMQVSDHEYVLGLVDLLCEVCGRSTLGNDSAVTRFFEALRLVPASNEKTVVALDLVAASIMCSLRADRDSIDLDSVAEFVRVRPEQLEHCLVFLRKQNLLPGPYRTVYVFS